MTDPQAAALAALEPLVEQAVVDGCKSGDLHLTCSYPACSCGITPRTIRAALLSAPVVELVRGLMEETSRLRDKLTGEFNLGLQTLERAEAAEASLSALRERVAAKDAAIVKAAGWSIPEPHLSKMERDLIRAAVAAARQTWEAERAILHEQTAIAKQDDGTQARIILTLRKRLANGEAERAHLDNLLARIFRDGGQRQAEFATMAKAVEAADKLCVEYIAASDERDEIAKDRSEIVEYADKLADERAVLVTEAALAAAKVREMEAKLAELRAGYADSIEARTSR